MYLLFCMTIVFTQVAVCVAYIETVIMKLKEIDRTANIAWSPASQHPIYLAAGTAAQQLDATFR